MIYNHTQEEREVLKTTAVDTISPNQQIRKWNNDNIIFVNLFFSWYK